MDMEGTANSNKKRESAKKTNIFLDFSMLQLIGVFLYNKYIFEIPQQVQVVKFYLFLKNNELLFLKSTLLLNLELGFKLNHSTS